MVSKQKILIVDDDNNIAELIALYLTKECFETMIVNDGESALSAVDSFAPNLILLDLMLPGADGFEICKQIREVKNTPILMVSAKKDDIDKIRGLGLGADDYITKPFRLGELCSRIRARLRRVPGEGLLCSGALSIDRLAGRALLRGRPLDLTAAEYRLLCFLVSHSGQTLSRAAILDALWDGQGSFVDDNTLSVYIRRLREKVEDDPSHPEHLRTIRGLGYQWKEAQP